jgi:hypothetical protein
MDDWPLTMATMTVAAAPIKAPIVPTTTWEPIVFGTLTSIYIPRLSEPPSSSLSVMETTDNEGCREQKESCELFRSRAEFHFHSQLYAALNVPGSKSNQEGNKTGDSREPQSPAPLPT